MFLSKTSLVLPWSTQPQFFRSYRADPISVVVVVVDVTVVINIIQVVGVTRIRRGQPDNYALFL